MRYFNFFLLGFLLFSFSSSAKIYIEIISQYTPPGWGNNTTYTARIVAGDDNDPTPNFCYSRYCEYAGFMNAPEWGENGNKGYSSRNGPFEGWKAVSDISPTLGELVKNLKKKGIFYQEFTDYLPYGWSEIGVSACIYGAEYYGGGNPYPWGQIAGTLISKCGEGRPPPAACSISQQKLEFDFGKIPQGKAKYIKKSLVIDLSCTASTRVKLKVGEGGVVLNGLIDKIVNFSFDEGEYDNTWKGDVLGSKRIKITAQLPDLEVGSWAGSSVIIMTVD